MTQTTTRIFVARDEQTTTSSLGGIGKAGLEGTRRAGEKDRLARTKRSAGPKGDVVEDTAWMKEKNKKKAGALARWESENEGTRTNSGTRGSPPFASSGKGARRRRTSNLQDYSINKSNNNNNDNNNKLGGRDDNNDNNSNNNNGSLSPSSSQPASSPPSSSTSSLPRRNHRRPRQEEKKPVQRRPKLERQMSLKAQQYPLPTTARNQRAQTAPLLLGMIVKDAETGEPLELRRRKWEFFPGRCAHTEIPPCCDGVGSGPMISGEAESGEESDGRQSQRRGEWVDGGGGSLERDTGRERQWLVWNSAGEPTHAACRQGDGGTARTCGLCGAQSNASTSQGGSFAEGSVALAVTRPRGRSDRPAQGPECSDDATAESSDAGLPPLPQQENEPPTPRIPERLHSPFRMTPPQKPPTFGRSARQKARKTTQQPVKTVDGRRYHSSGVRDSESSGDNSTLRRRPRQGTPAAVRPSTSRAIFGRMEERTLEPQTEVSKRAGEGAVCCAGEEKHGSTAHSRSTDLGMSDLSRTTIAEGVSDDTRRNMIHVQEVRDRYLRQLQQMIMEEAVEESRRAAALHKVSRYPLRRKRLQLRHARERQDKKALVSWIRRDIELIVVQKMAELGLIR